MSDVSIVYNVLGKDRASAVFSKVSGAAKLAMAAGAAAAGAFAVTSIKAYADAEQSQLKLQDAFEKFPGLADTNIDRLRALNTELAQKTKFDDDATASGQASLAMFKFTGKQIEDLTPLLQDFAAKTGMDMDAAAKVFGRAMLGQGRGLKAVGINFKDTGSAAGNYAQLMQGLSDKVGGFAEKEGKTAAGQTEILRNQFGELQEKVGGMLVPALLKLVPVLKQGIDFFDRNAKTILIVVGAVTGLVAIFKTITMVVRAYTMVQMILNVVMTANPIGLIVVAIGVLIAIIVLVATKTRFFQTIWEKVWGFLKAVGAWFAGPFAGFFKRVWNQITSDVMRVHNWIVSKFNAVIGFLTGMGARIRTLASTMWNGLIDSFKGVINGIIRMWNAIDFGIHVQLPDWLGGLGFHIDDVVPDIPYLAQGGIVTRPTLAFLGDRGPEAVVPLNRGGGFMRHEWVISGDADSAVAGLINMLIRTGKIKVRSSAVVPG